MRLGLSTPLVRMLDLHGDQNASAGVTARAVTPLSSARLMYASTWSRFWQPPSDSPTPYQRTCGSSSAWSSSTSPRGTAAHAGALAQRHSPTWTQCSTTKRVRASRSQCARGGRTAATTHKPWAEGAGCPASRRRQWTAANATRPDRRYQTGTSAAKSAFTPRHCRGDHLTDLQGQRRRRVPSRAPAFPAGIALVMKGSGVRVPRRLWGFRWSRRGCCSTLRGRFAWLAALAYLLAGSHRSHSRSLAARAASKGHARRPAGRPSVRYVSSASSPAACHRRPTAGARPRRRRGVRSPRGRTRTLSHVLVPGQSDRRHLDGPAP